MPKFRKKPVEIEAWQNLGAPHNLPDWLMNKPEISLFTGGHINIRTLEGEMRADIGDWIIRGVKGELYPIKNDIFRQTYEPTDAS
jgi:hypothetical protein